MCAPHPVKPGFLHVAQVVRLHMVVSFDAREAIVRTFHPICMSVPQRTFDQGRPKSTDAKSVRRTAHGGRRYYPMKGVIFTTFEDFISDTFGPEIYEDILDATELKTTVPFIGPGTYPASDLMALVSTAIAQLAITLETALTEFGKYSFPKLAQSVPSLMAQLPDAESFFMGLEDVIHTEVRKLDAEANPARFTPEETNDGVLLHYGSSLGLFPLVAGFVDGVAAWYGEAVHHEMISSEGTNATFLLKFERHLSGQARSAEALQRHG